MKWTKAQTKHRLWKVSYFTKYMTVLYYMCIDFENVPVSERENIVGVSSVIPANLRDRITSAVLLRCMKVKQYKYSSSTSFPNFITRSCTSSLVSSLRKVVPDATSASVFLSFFSPAPPSPSLFRPHSHLQRPLHVGTSPTFTAIQNASTSWRLGFLNGHNTVESHCFGVSLSSGFRGIWHNLSLLYCTRRVPV